MQVISGKLRGLKLDSIKNTDIRPTKDRIKESLFDILRFKIKDKVFLDLFGGTGQIGIEAFSQGASKVVIVELDDDNFNTIKKNINKIKIDNEISLYHSDSIEFLDNSKTRFDIVFLDPPYQNTSLLEQSLKKIENLEHIPELLLVETLSSFSLHEETNNFHLQKKYNYGKISLYLYEKK